MTELAGRLRAIPTWQVTLGLALFALGFLIGGHAAFVLVLFVRLFAAGRVGGLRALLGRGG